jgi:hypothetical protein
MLYALGFFLEGGADYVAQEVDNGKLLITNPWLTFKVTLI